MIQFTACENNLTGNFLILSLSERENRINLISSKSKCFNRSTFISPFSKIDKVSNDISLVYILKILVIQVATERKMKLDEYASW